MRIFTKKSIWLVVLLLAYQCTPTPRPTEIPSVPPRTLSDRHDFPWQEQWRSRMNLYIPFQNNRNLIAAVEGGIFAHNPTSKGSDDWLKFANAEDGILRWEIEIQGDICSMVADENRVYTVGIRNSKHVVTAYDLKTGEIIWTSEATLPGHQTYLIQFQADRLYVYSFRNEIYIFDPETGDLLDNYNAALNKDSEVMLQLDNGDVLQYDKKRLMLTRDKEIIWQTDHRAFVLNRLPIVYNDLVIIRFEEVNATFRGLMGIDLNTGETIWRRSDEFSSNFVIIDDLLYVISKDARILVLDPDTGRTSGFAQFLPNSVINQKHRDTGIAVNNNMMYAYFEDSQELIAFERMNK